LKSIIVGCLGGDMKILGFQERFIEILAYFAFLVVVGGCGNDISTNCPSGQTLSLTSGNCISSSTGLSGLTLSAGSLSPAFSTSTVAYTVDVPYADTSITITPSVLDPGMSMTVNGTSVSFGSTSSSIALSLGPNTISIVVLSQDGSVSVSYTLLVTRLSNVATLSALAPSIGTLSPSFSSSTYSYTMSVSSSSSTMTVTPTLTDATATMTVNGSAVASGATSSPIALGLGNTVITVSVTSADSTVAHSYVLTVTRPSNVSTLSNLILSAGTLSPSFASGTTSYTAVVGYATTAITVTPTITTNSNATITVNSSAVTSGSASGSINLTVGSSNTVTVAVTSQDGSSTTNYVIIFTRKSNDSTLSALSVSSGTLSPSSFASGTTAYTVYVPYTTSSLTVTPTVNQANATVTVNGVGVTSSLASGAINLNVGMTTISVVVTAQDTSFTTTYTLTVSQYYSSAGIQITSMSADGTSVGLSWTKAMTGKTGLTYSVYYSSANPPVGAMSTVSLITANGASGYTGTDINSATITGLTAGNSYVFNVIVSDVSNNKAAYQPIGTIMKSGLVIYYPFNGNMNDISSSGNNGVGVNSPTLASDRFGFPNSAYNFTRSSTQYIHSTNYVGIVGSAARTLSYWQKYSGAYTNAVMWMVDWSTTGTLGDGFGMAAVGSPESMYIWGDGSVDLNLNIPMTTKWEHWVLVYDGTTRSAYKNGSLDLPRKNGHASYAT